MTLRNVKCYQQLRSIVWTCSINCVGTQSVERHHNVSGEAHIQGAAAIYATWALCLYISAAQRNIEFLANRHARCEQQRSERN